MKKLLSILVFLTVFNITGFAQSNELNGWNKAKWGMSDEVLLETFHLKAIKIKEQKNPRFSIIMSLLKLNDSLKAHIMIPNFKISSLLFDVYFLVDSSNKLERVILLEKEKSTEAKYFYLKKLLTEKYGKPVDENKQRKSWKSLGSGVPDDYEIESVWNFVNTNIELEYREVSLPSSILKDNCFLRIMYYQSQTEDLDKL